ncbi:unnamed protein product [Orchesella dallaii]|uniref:Uncharacterized protein n=1 Tax=Orchesella dallaii TaxID=48710 RepID=A0ABP1QFP9_9HEXA
MKQGKLLLIFISFTTCFNVVNTRNEIYFIETVKKGSIQELLHSLQDYPRQKAELIPYYKKIYEDTTPNWKFPSVRNLEKYLSPFSHCFVHVTNYQNVDFTLQSTIPAVVRYQLPTKITTTNSRKKEILTWAPKGINLSGGAIENYFEFDCPFSQYLKDNVFSNGICSSIYKWKLSLNTRPWNCEVTVLMFPPLFLFAWRYFSPSKWRHILPINLSFPPVWNLADGHGYYMEHFESNVFHVWIMDELYEAEWFHNKIMDEVGPLPAKKVENYFIEFYTSLRKWQEQQAFEVLKGCNKVAVILPAFTGHQMAKNLTAVENLADVYVGKEVLYERAFKMEISGSVSVNQVMRAKLVLSSGIWNFWLKIFWNGAMFQEDTPFKKQLVASSLSGNILVVFTVLIFGIVCSTTVFVIEIRGIMYSFVIVAARFVNKCVHTRCKESFSALPGRLAGSGYFGYQLEQSVVSDNLQKTVTY